MEIFFKDSYPFVYVYFKRKRVKAMAIIFYV